MFPLAEAYAKALAAQAKLDSAAARAAQIELDQAMVAQLVAALGYERALDFVWAGGWPYPALARAAREANLPANTAGQVMQLAATTAHAAAAVHADAAMSLEQKRAALLALQQSVRPEVERLLPAVVQQRLEPEALAWFVQLGEGKYQPVSAILPGRVRTVGGGLGSAIAVTAPLPPGGNTPQLLPRPPTRQ